MSHSRAFTFVEVLMAIVVLGVGIFAALGALYAGTRKTDEIHDQALSMATAESVLADPGLVAWAKGRALNGFSVEAEHQDQACHAGSAHVLRKSIVKVYNAGTGRLAAHVSKKAIVKP